MKLTDGLYAFPQTVERNGHEVTIHPSAVSTPKGTILLDVGFMETSNQIEDNLCDAGLSWDSVHAIVLTHQDTDHVGALRDVTNRTGATVYAHPESAPYIDGRRHLIKSSETDRYPPTPVDVEITEGTTFRTNLGPMEVIFTPGHAPGHISLFFPSEALLIAGDAISGDAGALAVPKEAFTLDMNQALESIRKLGGREIERVLTYHGGPIDANSQSIRRLANSH